MRVSGPFLCQVPTAPWVGDNDRLSQGGCSREAGSSEEHWLGVERLPLPQSERGQALPRTEVQGLPAANHSCILIPVSVHTTLAVIVGV